MNLLSRTLFDTDWCLEFEGEKSMNFKVLNKSGIVLGVVIPNEDLHEAQESIKRDSELYQVISDLLSDPSVTPESEIMLPHGRRLPKTSEMPLSLHVRCMRMHSEKVYRCSIATSGYNLLMSLCGPILMVQKTWYLVSFDAATRSYTLIRNLALAGKVFWAYL